MAHTTTLRAQGATRDSDARLSLPALSRPSMYFISPCFPSAIHSGNTCNSAKSRTGAMPQRSNPASRAHRLMRVGRSGDKRAGLGARLAARCTHILRKAITPAKERNHDLVGRGVLSAIARLQQLAVNNKPR